MLVEMASTWSFGMSKERRCRMDTRCGQKGRRNPTTTPAYVSGSSRTIWRASPEPISNSDYCRRELAASVGSGVELPRKDDSCFHAEISTAPIDLEGERFAPS